MKTGVYVAGIMALMVGAAFGGGGNKEKAVLVMREGNSNDWFAVQRWDGPGQSFQTYQDPLAYDTSAWNKIAVGIGDADNNGETEIWGVLQEYGTGTTNDELKAWMWGGPGKTLTQVYASGGEGSAWSRFSVGVGDADNDGSNEVWVIWKEPASHSDYISCYTWAGPGHGLVGVGGPYVLDNGSHGWSEWDSESITVGDWDNNGTNEIVILARENDNELIRYYTWAGPGNNPAYGGVDYLIDHTACNKTSIGLGDADNDGDNELLITDQEADTDAVHAYSWAGPGNTPVEIAHNIRLDSSSTNAVSIGIGNVDNEQPGGTVLIIR